MEGTHLTLGLEELCECLLGATPAKSRHAQLRQWERNISDEAIVAALRWGRALFRRDGRREYHLDPERTKLARTCGEELENYLGTVVIVGPSGCVITVFRRGMDED